MKLAITALALVLTTGMSDQARPDFSGNWTSSGPGVWTGRGNSGTDSLQVGRFPMTMVISQDATTLTVDEQYVAGSELTGVIYPRNTLSYPLDGRTQSNKMPIAGPRDEYGVAPAEFRCHWDAQQLVAAFSVSVPGETLPRRYERKIWLDSDGTLMMQTLRVGTPHSLTHVFKREVKR